MNSLILFAICLACALTVSIASQETSPQHNRARRYTEEEAQLVLRALELLDSSKREKNSEDDSSERGRVPKPPTNPWDKIDDAQASQTGRNAYKPPTNPGGWRKIDDAEASKTGRNAYKPPTNPGGFGKIEDVRAANTFPTLWPYKSEDDPNEELNARDNEGDKKEWTRLKRLLNALKALE